MFWLDALVITKAFLGGKKITVLLLFWEVGGDGDAVYIMKCLQTYLEVIFFTKEI